MKEAECSSEGGGEEDWLAAGSWKLVGEVTKGPRLQGEIEGGGVCGVPCGLAVGLWVDRGDEGGLTRD